MVAAEDRGRANSEVAERARAWDEAEVKEKAEIARVATQAIKKAKAARSQRGRGCGMRQR